MRMDNSWYEVENHHEIDTPALLIYEDRVKGNIKLLTGSIDEVDRLRPHVKTHKSIDATQLIMEAGIWKFKCATIPEAEMLGMCGAIDVLFAYQPFGPKLDRLVKLMKSFPKTTYSCLVDNKNSAQSIASIALANDLVIPVYVDLNVGMNRTGIVPGGDAIELYDFCENLKGIRPIGLHNYDGHIRAVDLEERRTICEKSFAPVEEMWLKLIEKGFDPPRMVMGGSPTFPIYAKKKEVECGPGTFIYWDKGYLDSLPEQPFLPAALVMSRVVSLPAKDKICLDLGYKAIASENPLDQRIHFLNAPDLEVGGQSEEHLVLRAGENHSWKIGDVFYGIPIHICPTVAMYEKAAVIENCRYARDWKITSRDRRLTA